MKLQCPLCHSFVFKRFGAIEVLSVIAGLGVLGLAIAMMGIKGHKILLIALGIIAVQYFIRLIYIWIHNYRNENIY